LEQKHALVIIAVTDNGIGILPEIKDNIFKPSFTTKSSGMGMGLSLVKNMVEAMNGNIFFITELNIGTTFIVDSLALMIRMDLPIFKMDKAASSNNEAMLLAKQKEIPEGTIVWVLNQTKGRGQGNKKMA
jgi:hypothetical protein